MSTYKFFNFFFFLLKKNQINKKYESEVNYVEKLRNREFKLKKKKLNHFYLLGHLGIIYKFFKKDKQCLFLEKLSLLGLWPDLSSIT